MTDYSRLEIAINARKEHDQLSFGVQKSPVFLFDTTTWHCQVKECKIISEQSLVTGWLAELSTSFPIFPDTDGQNPGPRLGLLVTSGRKHAKKDGA